MLITRREMARLEGRRSRRRAMVVEEDRNKAGMETAGVHREWMDIDDAVCFRVWRSPL